MSDAETRDLERLWRESGDPAAKARWLQARLRVGELTPERLAVAAFARDPGARELVTGDAPADALVAAGFTNQAWAAWSAKLLELGWEATYRAGIADVRHKQELLEAAIAGDPLAHGHVDACRTVLARRAEVLEDFVLAGGKVPPRPLGVGVEFATHGLLIDPPGDLSQVYAFALLRTHGLARGLRTGVEDLSGLGMYHAWSLLDPARDAELLARIEQELAAWSLGLGDPLRLRLDRLEIASPCHMRWEDLEGDDRVRRCGECQLDVYDLSALTRAEAEALLRAREGRACVRILRRQDGRIQTRDCSAGLQRKLEPYQVPPPQLLGALPVV